MDLSIIGSGYVGLVTGACFADVGHNVICVDNDAAKVEALRSGKVPIYEPGLEEVIHRNVSAHRLRFSGRIQEAVDTAQVIFIAVPTPQLPNGDADLSSIEKVADGIGMDRRIGRSFLNAGIGYGGSCFPKDVAAFITISEQLGVPFSLLKEVQRINAEQKNRFLKVIRDALWVLREKKIAVWGLTFKPDTDDIRSSVAIDLVADMLREGAHVTVYDPKGMEKAREVKAIADAKFAASALEAAEGAEALVIATEWSDFANVDIAVVKEKMTTPIVFDGRNLFNPETMGQLGFHYHSIGRASVTPH